MSNLRNLPTNLPRLGAVVGILSAVVPGIFFKIITPTMNAWELGITIALMMFGAVVGFFLAARRPLLGFVIFPAALFGISLLCWYTFFSIRESKVAALRQRLADYTDIAFERPEGNSKSVPQIHGKIVAVDLKKKTIDPVHLLLPDALRADRPEEVGIVLQLNWGEETVGRYPRGGRAIRRFCDARVIEYSGKPRLLHEERFCGGDPPDRGGSSDMFGKPPYSQILEFLKTHSSS